METKREGEWLKVEVPSKWDGYSVYKIMKKEWHVPRKLMHRFRSNRELTINHKDVHWKDTKVRTGDTLHIRLFKPLPLEVSPSPMDIDVIYEDDHLLVVNKPSGVFTHPNTPFETDTLVNGVAAYFEENMIYSTPKYVHRLDRDTSGAILFAKHDLAIAMLGKELQKRTIKRTYLAWAHGIIQPGEGIITAPIGKDLTHPVRRCVSSEGQYAETHYKVLEYDKESNASLLSLQLQTGRTHQIRVHLSHKGHPLVGDEMYGGEGRIDFKQALHAAVLTFQHPFTEKIIKCFALPPANSPLFSERHLELLGET
ncbi:RluA family pseudouridine synthase [Halobacillus mangrovi]|uniref:Pseudouridine synthase n=1 Tax=Halobacillus mangrovi TaxID=402384 RepID=A0A1W5ZYK6_9BACI|nr:RluA family pseudouridine synthase [Halobacillus mangrovi]ARI78344.1 RNA pseudouridine synthase [Halobacillus mangrovi]